MVSVTSSRYVFTAPEYSGFASYLTAADTIRRPHGDEESRGESARFPVYPQIFVLQAPPSSTTPTQRETSAQEFPPLKSRQLRQLWAALLPVCTLLDQHRELQAYNNTSGEIEAMNGIVDNIINDTCDWVSL